MANKIEKILNLISALCIILVIITGCSSSDSKNIGTRKKITEQINKIFPNKILNSYMEYFKNNNNLIRIQDQGITTYKTRK